MNLGDQFLLTYCTNIHPGPDWETTFKSLRDFVPDIKSQVAHQGSFGLGLRLSNKASEELNGNGQMATFKHWLEEQNCFVFTMNGFPYGNFHGERVKDKVHLPDWTSGDRLRYSSRLFEQLAELAEPGSEAGISTSPLSYRHWHQTDETRHRVLIAATENLVLLTLKLRELENKTGSYLHLDLEPEPDGLLENSEDVLNFFREYLLHYGADRIRTALDVSQPKAEEIILRYICICYDVCHFALAYEEPEYSFEKFSSLGIRVGKIQISAALKILAGTDVEAVYKDLEQFDEPTYLHQVTQLKEGKVQTYPDLPDLLASKPQFDELRAHFHVPVFLESFDRLFSTQDHILKVLSYIKEQPVCRHLEVETYTWEVLPKHLKTELATSIARELNWVIQKLGT